MNHDQYDEDLKMILNMEKGSQEQREAVVKIAEKYGIDMDNVTQDLGNMQAYIDNEDNIINAHSKHK